MVIDYGVGLAILKVARSTPGLALSGNNLGQVVPLSPSSKFGTGQGAVMPRAWEGKGRSGVTPAMRHRLWWLIHLRAHGLRNGYEHPAYTPQGGTLYTLHGMQMQYKPMLHCYIDYSRVAVSVLLSCLLYTWAYLILQCLSGCVFAFIALTLLVERQKQHSACKNWMMRYQCGYMSGARCRLFAYGPADAVALASFNQSIY